MTTESAWLMDRGIAYAKAHPHPERPEQTVWEVFEEERPKLIAYRGRFDGFHAQQASVSKTRLVRFDNNKSMTCRRLQLRAKAQDPQRPYALRVRLQTMDNRTRTIRLNPLQQMPGLNN
jgi:hypothetical protein